MRETSTRAASARDGGLTLHRARAAWPYAALDVPALRAAGHRPSPLRQFVFKMRSRCNLACTYCYVYEMADRGWREQPGAMDAATVRAAAERIAEHAVAHRLDRVDVVLHGGEPLLASDEELVRPVRAVRRALRRRASAATVTASVQTNGTLITPARLDALAAAGIRVGVSLDGGLERHNRERADHVGRSRFDDAVRGVRLLARRPGSFAGVLAVIDLDHDPVEVYTSLADLGPPSLGLLLPLANWSNPPPPGRRPASRTPYADWLVAVFEQWWHEPVRRTRIRIFEEIIALLLGVPAATETLGAAPVTTVVIETDGSLEQGDSLKSAYDGAARTGCHVASHSFDEVLQHPGFVARQLGLRGLADACRACDLVRVCGGGHYPHRYRAGAGFRQPSVYCADLDALVRHVAAALDRQVRAHRAAAGAAS
ncbi:FxsB family cyclophane-forming radical SAM/SPASM peptide maturase [Streptomyces antimicrobicus]|uniref:FxsB family radical SAM/SPASM domain protein n=1 Tax=Streptomyces antimicrobicus TaxID=2883108 RepID=A0ABS8B701_9ACTN|nr:FxsB family cyclophane-forming radical SAM/SPASM peptide maturase [Streptomyces antimicrobicus]MCB5180387.1 FxsB family radical SAM/SPASM domain protein [Streptomyces antimicrobicus]